MGVCNQYASAFAVMTRAIGLESYKVSGWYLSSGKTISHQWVVIKLNGVFYTFDAQVEHNMSKNGIKYTLFGLTPNAATAYYRYDNMARDISYFGNFAHRYPMSATTSLSSSGGANVSMTSKSRQIDNFVVCSQPFTVSAQEIITLSFTFTDGRGPYKIKLYSGGVLKNEYQVSETGSVTFAVSDFLAQSSDMNLVIEDAAGNGLEHRYPVTVQ